MYLWRPYHTHQVILAVNEGKEVNGLDRLVKGQIFMDRTGWVDVSTSARLVPYKSSTFQSFVLQQIFDCTMPLLIPIKT